MSPAADSRARGRIEEGGDTLRALDRSGDKRGAGSDTRLRVNMRTEGMRTREYQQRRREVAEVPYRHGEEKVGFDAAPTEAAVPSHGLEGARAGPAGDRLSERPSRKTSYPIDRRHWQKRSHMALQETGTGSRPRGVHGNVLRGLRAKDVEGNSFAAYGNTGVIVPVSSSLEEATGPPSAPETRGQDGDAAGGLSYNGRGRTGVAREVSRKPEAALDDHLLSWVNSVLSSPGSETADSSRSAAVSCFCAVFRIAILSRKRREPDA